MDSRGVDCSRILEANHVEQYALIVIRGDVKGRGLEKQSRGRKEHQGA